MTKCILSPLGKKRVAVLVKRIGLTNSYKVVPGIHMLNETTLMCRKPENRIIDDQGDEIKPCGCFLWTAESLSPYHLVVDWF